MIVNGMGWDEYERVDGINWSSLRLMAKSPAHYRHNLSQPREDTPALRMGRCVHMAVLEPETFAKRCAVWRGGIRRGKEWDAFVAAHTGQEILTTDEREECDAIAAAVRGHRVAGAFVSGGNSEVSMTWLHEESAIGGTLGLSMKCKGRMDFVSDLGVIVDLKTTRDASADAFGKTAANFKYPAQGAWYQDGYERATGVRLPVVFIAAESTAPYALVVYRVADDILDLGRQEYTRLLRRLDDCRRTNTWDGYADSVQELSLPRWAIPRDDENDVSGLGLNFNAGE